MELPTLRPLCEFFNEELKEGTETVWTKGLMFGRVCFHYHGLFVSDISRGGTRSILQLRILSVIQERTEIGLPIQDFFDLIIGTRYYHLHPVGYVMHKLTLYRSSGGVIALGLGECDIPIEKCESLFLNSTREAFKLRVLGGVPWIKKLVKAQYGSQYRSRGLNDALGRALGGRVLFGEADGTKKCKVGVTAESSRGETLLIANYNRNGGPVDKENGMYLRNPQNLITTRTKPTL